MVRSPSNTRKHIREALLWEASDIGRDYVKCNLCHRRCIIAPGRYGACGVRKNVGGKLYTIVYGLLSAANLDPIEKKPLMHFEPGSQVFSISTVGCNFYCKFCQNWSISQARLEKGLYGEYLDPEKIVDYAVKMGAHGISYTYNEPTIFFELMLDTARSAKQRGLFNTMVTNGYATPEAIEVLAPYMDAATVDFKGGGNKQFYRKFMGVPDPDPIYQTLLEMKEKGIWIEITNLVVPQYGDREEDIKALAEWVANNLGEETPFHLLRFHPDYLLTNIPATPLKTMEKLAKIAIEEGLKHVFLGNVWGHPLEHTYCPKCGYPVIERKGFYITAWRLKEGNRCPRCSYRVNVKGGFHGHKWSPLSII